VLQHLVFVIVTRFRVVRKAPVAFVMSVRLAVSPRVTARLPLDGFSEILETVIYVCRETLKFGYNRTKMSGTSHEHVGTVYCYRQNKIPIKALSLSLSLQLTVGVRLLG